MATNTHTWFLTFGGGSQNYVDAVDRIVSQANSLNLFDSIYGFKESDLRTDQHFWNNHGQFILGNSRGFGHWIWKPYLIKQIIDKANKGDIIVYCDSGNEFDVRKRNQIKELIEKTKKEQLIATYPSETRTPYLDDIRWNKQEVISYFNLSFDSPILYTNQLQANPILICKNDFTTAFIYEWYKICSENYHLIDDSITVPQHKEYIQNRHDQSVFSLLAKQYNLISTTVARDVIETNRNRSGYSEFEEGSNKYIPYKRIRPVTQSIGFILLRHVNSVAANQYWQYAYSCIRKLYPSNKIVIIDSQSDPALLTEIPMENTDIIVSEFEGRGEIMPYYYYLQYKWFDVAVFIHDSVFIHHPVDFYTTDYKMLWGFDGHTIGEREPECIEMITSLRNHDPLLQFYREKKGTWIGCFGSMTSISYAFLEHLNNKYSLHNMIPLMGTKNYREAFERVFGCILQHEIAPEFVISNNILTYLPYGILFDQRNNYSHLPVIKIWGGR